MGRADCCCGWSEFRKTLIHLTVDGWGCVPSLLVVLPEATQHWSLPGLFGGANGRLWEGSCQGVLPRTSPASFLVLTVKQSQPPPLQETLQHEQVGLVQSPPGSLLLPPGPDAHTIPCVPSKSGVSVSPSPVEVLQSIPTRLQSPILYEFLLLLPDPQVGKPDMGLITFTPVGGLLWYKCSPVCESPTHPPVMGYDFTLIAPLLPSHCGFSLVFECGVSSFVKSSVFLSMTVQQPVVILDAVLKPVPSGTDRQQPGTRSSFRHCGSGEVSSLKCRNGEWIIFSFGVELFSGSFSFWFETKHPG